MNGLMFKTLRMKLQRRLNLALATFALGMVMFALFFGLIAACDQL